MSGVEVTSKVQVYDNDGYNYKAGGYNYKPNAGNT